MNFKTFSVNTTNIFPIANTTKGGQLVTEFNLKSRESVATDPNVKYTYGPSYTHGQDDFAIGTATDSETGTSISTTILQISQGRCVLNGHFVENLVDMQIDIVQANAQAKKLGQSLIQGVCCVGLKAMYSTEVNIAGSLQAENNDTDLYEGVQVVILPVAEFKLPSDVPDNQNEVTAHLKLGTFTYNNGIIKSSISQNKDKIKNIDGSRIYNIDSLLSKQYISKANLDPHKLYTFATKNVDDSSDLQDTWCDSTDSLMVWDSSPQEEKLTNTSNNPKEASFKIDSSTEQIKLVVPHKQIDGMRNTHGEATYYVPKTLNIPVADYDNSTPGTVSSSFIKIIKKIDDKVKNLYSNNKEKVTQGNLIGVINVLDADNSLPIINKSWAIGDYILVVQDTLVGSSADSERDPSTMYIVTPGYVKTVKYIADPSSLSGMCVGTVSGTDPGETKDTPSYFDFSIEEYRGIPNKDYLVYVYVNPETNASTKFYYQIATSSGNDWSEPIMLTASIPYATEDLVGGFKNVPDDAIDEGYIKIDENGHLILLDYSLLRSGTLAYQLGEDYTSPSGITNEAIQDELNDYVNDRVAFANSTQRAKKGTSSNVIDITLNLSKEEEESTITIQNIDSRFNTCVYLHIAGTEVDSNTIINIVNCEKIRIDSNIGGVNGNKPRINLYNSCLYYDSGVLGTLNSISGLSLWYEKYENTDPDILVNNMTVQAVNSPIIAESTDFWATDTPNDNHFRYALQSVTYGKDGNIIGFGIYINNSTTSNIMDGRSIYVSDFTIPQGSALTYPENRVTNKLKISGAFVTSYATILEDGTTGYQVIETMFSAVTGTYDGESIEKGVISFSVNANKVYGTVYGITPGDPIDAWDSGAYHVFTGGALN